MGLVRSVFSKGRAGVFVPGVNGKKYNGGEKKRWGIDVRSYFRENEYLDSVGADAEEDANSSDSAHWSEASTVNNGIINKSEGAEDDNQRQLQSQYCDKKEDGTKVCWSGVDEDSAATLIQSVFRAFLARRRVHEGWNKLGEAKGGGVHENGIDNSKGKLTPTNQKTRRAKNRIAKPKEEWDNTVSSSTVSQLRNQHRLEAAMKREKALAYAFSHQLRTFNSKKKNRTQPSGDQHQTDWSWLEKWIASHPSVNSLPILKEQPTSLNKAGANNFHTKRCMVSNEEIQLVSTKKFAASRCPAATQKITKVISKADAISSTKKENNMKKKVIIIRSGSGKIKDAVDINLRPGQGIVA